MIVGLALARVLQREVSEPTRLLPHEPEENPMKTRSNVKAGGLTPSGTWIL